MDKTPDRIAEQAAEYFAQRRGATLPQRRTRDAWMREDVRHAQAYEEFEGLWDQAGRLADDPELHELKAADLAALKKSNWFRPQRLIAVAALLVVMVGAGYFLQPLLNPPPPLVAYATALGERRTETLADGTQLVLNTDSALEVRYAKDRRSISLRRGEAQFDVAKDASRPFVVHIGQDSVTALGTRFQVRRDLSSTVVTLLEGEVEVAQGPEKYVLRPNERAVLSERTGISIAAVDPEFATGWLDGWLRFRGVPLAEVIAEANRYSDQKLRLGDPRLADIELSGNFHAGDNSSIADAVSLILPLRIERRGSELVLLPQ